MENTAASVEPTVSMPDTTTPEWQEAWQHIYASHQIQAAVDALDVLLDFDRTHDVLRDFRPQYLDLLQKLNDACCLQMHPVCEAINRSRGPS